MTRTAALCAVTTTSASFAFGSDGNARRSTKWILALYWPSATALMLPPPSAVRTCVRAGWSKNGSSAGTSQPRRVSCVHCAFRPARNCCVRADRSRRTTISIAHVGSEHRAKSAAVALRRRPSPSAPWRSGHARAQYARHAVKQTGSVPNRNRNRGTVLFPKNRRNRSRISRFRAWCRRDDARACECAWLVVFRTKAVAVTDLGAQIRVATGGRRKGGNRP